MCMPVSESVCISLREILDTASHLPLYIFLALPPSRISMLESAQRQQPARHEYKGRQTSRRRGKKKKKRKSQRRLGQAQGTQAVQRQAGSEHSASHKAAFSCRTKKTLRKWKRIHRKRKGGDERYIWGFVWTTFCCLWRHDGWPYCLPMENWRSSLSFFLPVSAVEWRSPRKSSAGYIIQCEIFVITNSRKGAKNWLWEIRCQEEGENG